MIFIPGIWFVNTWPLIALCHSLLMSSQYNHGDLWNTYIQIHSVHACGMACGNDNPLHHRYHYLWLCNTYIYNYIGFLFIYLFIFILFFIFYFLFIFFYFFIFFGGGQRPIYWLCNILLKLAMNKLSQGHINDHLYFIRSISQIFYLFVSDRIHSDWTHIHIIKYKFIKTSSVIFTRKL